MIGFRMLCTEDVVEQARRMILSAVPLPPSELKTLFRSGDDSIRKLLERPPTLRSSGWDLETGGQAQIVRGELVRVASGDRKVLELYRDGTFVFVCRADDWFLAWASPRGKERLNPLALVEVTFSFMNLYKSVLTDLSQPPSEIQVRVDFRNLHLGGQKTSLVPHALGTYAQLLEMEVHEAPDNDVTLARKFGVRDLDPSAAAYSMIREIYLWFGIDEEKIPYVRRDSGAPAVDVDAISKTR
jgi:hypothetical protein